MNTFRLGNENYGLRGLSGLIQVIAGLPKDLIRFTQYIVRTMGFSLER